MIQLKNINKYYSVGNSKLHVLKNLNLSISKGELVAIMGSSGSGKSTLLNILGILDEVSDGDYHLDGVEIKNLSETIAAKYRNKFLGFIFQSFNLISYKTAIDNISLPLYYQGVPKKERNEIAAHYLDKVGLSDRGHHLPNELSGGQKQRVAIARALATNPKVLLADELTGALDSKTSIEIMSLVQQINDAGNTVLIVTHEPEVADMCKRVVLLKDGKILEDKANEQHRLI